jgi:hypothetical protein
VAVRAVKVALALNPVEVIFLSGLIRAKAEELAHFKSFLLVPPPARIEEGDPGQASRRVDAAPASTW